MAELTGTPAEEDAGCVGTEHTFFFAVFDKYMTISGFQIEETIDRETSGDLEKLLLAVGNEVLLDLELLFFQCQASWNWSCYRKWCENMGPL